MRVIKIDDLKANWRRRRQYHHACNVLNDHPEAVVLEIADEWTCQRFGEADKRQGRAIKLGHTTNVSQTWISWAACDVEFATVDGEQY